MLDERHAHYDLIIRNGDLIDGTGAPRRAADLGVRHGEIAAIGDLGAARADTEVNATGLIVAPGFIDTHTHDDWMVFQSPEMLPKVTQGVTTIIAGNCGISLFPLVTDSTPPAPLDIMRGGYRFDSVRAYREAFAASPAAVNVAVLVGQSTLRAGHVHQLGEAASDAEIEQMRQDVEDALLQGAIGVSTGTFYPPSAAAPEDEIVRMCEPMRRLGGVLVSHMRDESDNIRESIDETARAYRQGTRRIDGDLAPQARRQAKPLVVAATRSRRSANWPGTCRLCLDCYPYAASSTMLRPERVTQCDRILITWSATHPEAAGQYLEDLAQQWGRLAARWRRRCCPAGAVYFIMDEADVRDILAYPDTMVGSDGIPSDETPHPRLWGTFPACSGAVLARTLVSSRSSARCTR